MPRRAHPPIRRIRDRLGLTQTRMGDILGVTYQRVQQLERGAQLTSNQALTLWEEYPGVLKAEGIKLEDLLRG